MPCTAALTHHGQLKHAVVIQSLTPPASECVFAADRHWQSGRCGEHPHHGEPSQGVPAGDASYVQGHVHEGGLDFVLPRCASSPSVRVCLARAGEHVLTRGRPFVQVVCQICCASLPSMWSCSTCMSSSHLWFCEPRHVKEVIAVDVKAAQVELYTCYL